MTIKAPDLELNKEIVDFADKEMHSISTAMRWASQLQEVLMVGSGDTPETIEPMAEVNRIDTDVFLASIAKSIMVVKHARLQTLEKDCDCCSGKQLYEMFIEIPSGSPYGNYIVIAIADPAVINKLRAKDAKSDHVIH